MDFTVKNIVGNYYEMDDGKPKPYEEVTRKYKLPFPLYPFQQKTVNELSEHQNIGLYYDQGCVDAETEFLTPQGWKRIDEYQEGDLVLQANPDGSTQFVKPDEYIKVPAKELYHFKTKYGVDMMICPLHRVPHWNPEDRTKFAETTGQDVWETQNRTQRGWRGRIKTTFNTPDNNKKPVSGLTLDELRLQVAVMADGHFPSKTKWVHVQIKKERKKERLVQLLEKAGVEYVRQEGPWKGREGFSKFKFLAPLRAKHYWPELYNATQDELATIFDEVFHWDGTVRKSGNKTFFSKSKADMDFIQFVCATQGKRASIHGGLRQRTDGRPDAVEYSLNVVSDKSNEFVGISSRPVGVRKPYAKIVPTKDGFKYCFRVPSTYLMLRRNGRIFFTGNCGKTATSIVIVLHKFLTGEATHALVLMPPILIDGWARTIREIPGLSALEYRGTPAQRKKLAIGSTDFTLMSYDIFKRDFDRIEACLYNHSVVTIADEATALKNIASQNHKKFIEFTSGKPRMLLTGTPLSNPMDGYAYCKMVAPGIYRNKRQFENIHVAARDFMFGNVLEWQHLDLLAENMKVNAARVLRQDVIDDLPEVTYTPIPYRLEGAHYRLYKQLAEEQLLVLSDGGKIDATQSTALYNALQQIVVNYDHFADDPKKRSASFDLIDTVMEELEGKKLIVAANYRMSNNKIFKHLQKYNPRIIYGGNTAKQNSDAVTDFKEDSTVQVLVMQPTSGGYGIDGLQQVCNDVLFIESPIVPRDFHQLVARVHRNGQKQRVNIRIAYALDTIQVHLHGRLLDKDELINTLVRGPEDLRKALYGQE